MRYRTERVERLFVVRIWCEEGAAPRTFRGSVHDVEDGRRLGFSTLADLEGLLLSRLGLRASGCRGELS